MSPRGPDIPPSLPGGAVGDLRWRLDTEGDANIACKLPVQHKAKKKGEANILRSQLAGFNGAKSNLTRRLDEHIEGEMPEFKAGMHAYCCGDLRCE